MIARHEAGQPDITDVWAKLAAPLPKSAIAWRQDGKPVQRDGKYIARFVSYVEANTVRERLDMVVPGDWNLTLELLPQPHKTNKDGIETVEPDAAFAFKARLQILGVVREDVGHGKDYKQASTDAFKRVAVRFGIAAELYDMEQNWVQVDGDGKYAKAVEDPQAAYERRHGGRGSQAPASKSAPAAASAPARPAPTGADAVANAVGKRMPFGKHKGQMLTDIPDDVLQTTIEWCEEKDATKFADLIDACRTVLGARDGVPA